MYHPKSVAKVASTSPSDTLPPRSPIPAARLDRTTTPVACSKALGSASTSSYRAASNRAARSMRVSRSVMTEMSFPYLCD